MEELKKKAAPKNAEVLEATLEQNILLVNQLTLLDRLCTLKENQQISDDAFRDSWRNAKIFDTRVSVTVLLVAAAGVYLDVIEVNSNSAIITWLSALFGV